MKYTYIKQLADALNNLTDISKRMCESLEHQEVRHNNEHETLGTRNWEFVKNGNGMVSFICEERWRGQVIQDWDVFIDIHYL